MKDAILALVDDPAGLEAIYREDAAAFAEALPAALEARPESLLLQAWQARLAGEDEAPGEKWRSLVPAFLVALAAGAVARLPFIFESMNDERFMGRNLPFLILLPLAAWFLRQAGLRRILWLALPAALGLLYLNVLPVATQTTLLACLHMAFFFWALTGLAFLGAGWRDPTSRLGYLRLNGELLMFSTLVAIGGGVTAGITVELFRVLGFQIEEWYFETVGMHGLVALLLVAAILARRFAGRGRAEIAPLIAKVFSPLFLVTVVIYLGAMLAQGRNPFIERDFLIIFNVLLLVVMGLSVFSLSGRAATERRLLNDYVTAGLLLVTLLIDTVALSAIIFRLASWGLTPNRVTILGANLIIFVHLLGLLYWQARFLLGRAGLESQRRWTGSYLPVYAIWSLAVALLFPILWSFA